ncbi:expressed unknown protein [Seminavis robusta]|uniref:Uncharacterized protein n=1 Tax=Seminavis robusta TaxID=568900 RepID=A0A9N8H7Q4_9STRA|nr:expressed unknown protein [Seminavis robusta]|eukprot:Sro136_g064001.1  (154) ;mRNA; r:29008-29469
MKCYQARKEGGGGECERRTVNDDLADGCGTSVSKVVPGPQLIPRSKRVAGRFYFQWRASLRKFMHWERPPKTKRASWEGDPAVVLVSKSHVKADSTRLEPTRGRGVQPILLARKKPICCGVSRMALRILSNIKQCASALQNGSNSGRIAAIVT